MLLIRKLTSFRLCHFQWQSVKLPEGSDIEHVPLIVDLNLRYLRIIMRDEWKDDNHRTLNGIPSGNLT